MSFLLSGWNEEVASFWQNDFIKKEKGYWYENDLKIAVSNIELKIILFN